METLEADFRRLSYDRFMISKDKALNEITAFNNWLDQIKSAKIFGFEAEHRNLNATRSVITRETGEELPVLTFGGYNYLGYGYHPEVIAAAQKAIADYGLGAYASPVLNGKLRLHGQLENALLEFFGLSATHGVTLFSSGYGVCQGTIQAFCNPGNVVLIDEKAHISIIDGARASGAQVMFFKHNDLEDLKTILTELKPDKRVLICVEGVYSTDGDYCPLDKLVELAKRYGAYTFVDEAHSVLIAGQHGRGACEYFNVLDQVDLYVMTFSKAFGGAGGALLAKREITNYMNCYAKCRAYSCALDPAVTGGLIKVLELAAGQDGQERRQKIKTNAAYMQNQLAKVAPIIKNGTWIIPVVFKDELIAFDVYDFIQRQGLDASLHMFPAVAKQNARIRLFMTAEHTLEQLNQCVEIIANTAKRFNFSV